MFHWSWLMLFPLLAGCTSILVSADYDPQADFSALHSYDWLPAPRVESGEPEIQYDSLLGSRIRDAVDEQLQHKGFTPDADGADFLVTYNVAIDQRVSVTYLDDLYGYRRGPGWYSSRPYRYADFPGPGMMATEYKQGTLILDVVRASDKQLLWRGTATAEIQPQSSPEAREKRVREAVQKILEQFPPPK
jgi:hypothetical protein